MLALSDGEAFLKHTEVIGADEEELVVVVVVVVVVCKDG